MKRTLVVGFLTVLGLLTAGCNGTAYGVLQPNPEDLFANARPIEPDDPAGSFLFVRTGRGGAPYTWWPAGTYRIDGRSIGRRALRNVCLAYLAAGDRTAGALHTVPK